MKKSISLLFISYILLGGCTSSKLLTKIENRLHDINFNIKESLVLVADNQFHNIYCDPSFPGSDLSDDLTKVAIRPPQLNLFAPDLFVYSLKEDTKDKRIIHLGDALNIASSYEWKEFIKAMNAVNSMGWVMIPGNHDFYYYGNVAGEPDLTNGKCGRSGWVDAANTTGVQREFCPIIKEVPFTKDLFIKEYIKAIVAQPDKGFPKESQILSIYKDNNKKSLKSFFEWKNEADNPFINRIAGYYYDDYYYWKSFIVQELSVENNTGINTKIILLDTTDYKKRPSFKKITNLAGVKGEISKIQQNIVKRWINEENKDNKIIGNNYILIGHHPFKELTKDTKAWIKNYHFIYISAHTHDPITAHTYTDEYDKEINIGSITDTPETPTELYEPSPQYAILREGDGDIIKDKTAEKIINKALDDNNPFPLRSQDYYTEYKNEYNQFWDNNKRPHRNNIKILARTYLDMFDFFEKNKKTKPMYKDLNPILNEQLIRIKHQLIRIKESEDNDIKKHEVMKYINILKEAKEIDVNLKNTLNQQYCKDRLFYGAWEALQASLAEAGYCINEANKTVEKCK